MAEIKSRFWHNAVALCFALRHGSSRIYPGYDVAKNVYSTMDYGGWLHCKLPTWFKFAYDILYLFLFCASWHLNPKNEIYCLPVHDINMWYYDLCIICGCNTLTEFTINLFFTIQQMIAYALVPAKIIYRIELGMHVCKQKKTES